MRKFLVVFAIMAMFTTPVFAATFVNGGFEDGTFNGWIKDGGLYYGSGSYVQSGDQGKTAIVSSGTDPLTNNQLQMVFSGDHSARVNNYDMNYHYSTIKQTVNNWTDSHIYFAWAAVLEEPINVHSPDTEAPHFRIALTDNTTNTVLYNEAYNVYNIPGALVHDGAIDWYYGTNNGTYKWVDWQVKDLDVSNSFGHDLTLELLASDCGWGGHGGYAYLDGFGAKPPEPGVVPEPASLSLLGLGLLGLLKRKRV